MNNLTDRQKDFLNAAIKIVSEDGFSKFTIRNVAAIVGVTEPAVYRHFPNKLALLSAMLDDLEMAILPHFHSLIKNRQNAKNSFTLFIHGLFEEFIKRPAIAPFIFSEEIFHNEPQLREKLQQVLGNNIAVLTEAFEAIQIDKHCRGDIDPEQMALQTLASIRLSVTRWHLKSGELRLDILSDQLIDTLCLLFKLDNLDE